MTKYKLSFVTNTIRNKKWMKFKAFKKQHRAEQNRWIDRENVFVLNCLRLKQMRTRFMPPRFRKE